MLTRNPQKAAACGEEDTRYLMYLRLLAGSSYLKHRPTHLFQVVKDVKGKGASYRILHVSALFQQALAT